MIDLFLAAQEPPKSPLIDFVTETKIEIIVPPEPTIEEKIASNYYNCDESTQWIRADDATCLTKRLEYSPSESTSTTKRTNTPVTTQNKATASQGWFPKYQCTYHVWTKRPVGQWNDANDWYWQAQRDGWATGTTPQVGAIGWEPGHVVYIEAVDGDRVYISERNYDNHGSYREMWKPASEYKYIY